MNLQIKADGISHLTDARYFAALDAEYIVLDMRSGSPLTPAHIHAISDWVDGPEILIQIDFPVQEELDEWVKSGTVSGFQLPLITRVPAIESGLACQWIYTLPYSALDAEIYSTLKSGSVDILQVSFSGKDLNNDVSAEFAALKQVCRCIYVDIEQNVIPKKIAETVTQLAPYGLNIRGSSEEKPGYKSFDEIDTILELLELI